MTQLALEFIAATAIAIASPAPAEPAPAPAAVAAPPDDEPTFEPGRFELVAVHDLRPIDWLTGKREPLAAGDGHECDRCGRLHAICYEVRDTKTGRSWVLGVRCMGIALDGWSPDKKVLAAARREEREAARAAAADRMRGVAEQYAVELLRHTIPEPVATYTLEPVGFDKKVAVVHRVAGRVVPCDDEFRHHSFEEHDAKATRRACYETIRNGLEQGREDRSARREMTDLALTIVREKEEFDISVTCWVSSAVAAMNTHKNGCNR